MRLDHTQTEAKSLRMHLREATAYAHNQLDASMRPASDWRSRDDYIQFLKAQYTARLSVEGWLTLHAPPALRPPEQTPLILQDLTDLGETTSVSRDEFDLDYRTEATALGIAWVLAGSSLGNRAMLNDMNRALPERSQYPHTFLGSDAMSLYWKALRHKVDAPAPRSIETETVRAAKAVFEHFLAVVRRASNNIQLEGAK